jgi:hypothetical protein
MAMAMEMISDWDWDWEKGNPRKMEKGKKKAVEQGSFGSGSRGCDKLEDLRQL